LLDARKGLGLDEVERHDGLLVGASLGAIHARGLSDEGDDLEGEGGVGGAEGGQISARNTVGGIASANVEADGRVYITLIDADVAELGDELCVGIIDDVAGHDVGRGDIAAGPEVGPDGALLRDRKVLAANENARDLGVARRSSGNAHNDIAVGVGVYGVTIEDGRGVVGNLDRDLLIGRGGTSATVLLKTVIGGSVRHDGFSFLRESSSSRTGETRKPGDS